MNPRAARVERPWRLLRFLLAMLLLLPALLSGYTLHGPPALEVGLPFTAAVAVFPSTRRHRIVGIALGLVSLLILSVASRNNADIARVLMVTLAIVGFFAWARWTSDESG